MTLRGAVGALLIALALIGTAAAPGPQETGSVTNDELVAEVQTSKGTMVLELHGANAPKHVQNFQELAGKGFYDGLTFHRIIPGFMIQGGCPKGDGTGGPGYQVKAEFNDSPHVRGALSMARAAHPDSAGSQFFIVHETAPHLDGKYTNFGQLLSGYSVLDAIAAAGSPGGTPNERVTIDKVTVRARTPEDKAEDA